MKRGMIAILLVLLLWCGWSIHAIVRDQFLQYEALRWQGPTDQRFCQVSVYPGEGELNAAQAAMLESDMKRSFPPQETAASIVSAYGSRENGFAEYSHRKTDAEIWQVSENFFLLHSFPMVSGSAGSFAQNGDEAVLNESAAFALFGSNDCVGESVRVGPLGWRVLAVVKEPDGSLNEAAYAWTPRIWLPIRKDSDVSFYEAILPEYYSGFAAQTLENATGRNATSSTGRFQLPRLWEDAKAFFQTPPTQQPDLLPWEQAARLAERKLCLLWTIVLLLTLCLLFLVVPLCVKSAKRKFTRAQT